MQGNAGQKEKLSGTERAEPDRAGSITAAQSNQMCVFLAEFKRRKWISVTDKLKEAHLRSYTVLVCCII